MLLGLLVASHWLALANGVDVDGGSLLASTFVEGFDFITSPPASPGLTSSADFVTLSAPVMATSSAAADFVTLSTSDTTPSVNFVTLSASLDNDVSSSVDLVTPSTPIVFISSAASIQNSSLHFAVSSDSVLDLSSTAVRDNTASSNLSGLSILLIPLFSAAVSALCLSVCAVIVVAVIAGCYRMSKRRNVYQRVTDVEVPLVSMENDYCKVGPVMATRPPQGHQQPPHDGYTYAVVTGSTLRKVVRRQLSNPSFSEDGDGGHIEANVHAGGGGRADNGNCCDSHAVMQELVGSTTTATSGYVQVDRPESMLRQAKQEPHYTQLNPSTVDPESVYTVPADTSPRTSVTAAAEPLPQSTRRQHPSRKVSGVQVLPDLPTRQPSASRETRLNSGDARNDYI